jgi:hypothetical protein
MTQSAGCSLVGRLHEADFCAFNSQKDRHAGPHKEKRCATRFIHEEPVILETQEGDLIGAVVMNYSKNGLYFESDLRARRGVVLHIRSEATLANPDGGGCSAEVRWSRPLEAKTTEYRYGTGVRYC